MAVADVFSSLICILHITAPDAMVIAWLAIMKDANSMPGGGLQQKMSLLKQRFEGMFLTIDSVK
ncbi:MULTISPECIES: hypothetical protein [unclassified Janthinobacterium]|uniref:hypothetical protein n=1 Tax=unclassified Janthinobacterium TaxID=2610881 RepID=UPI0016164C41|nr:MULTISPECIES: hypothetical protein [unclassified Janthinobacterium]MBB5609077.1 hypothetical protein [Janthinobacterium sp. S3T4]MBB5614192.1 hypothetical protein [Janthinobacterium sp. S3M3]